MNWKQEAIDDLKSYNAKQESLTNLRDRMGALKAQYESIRSDNPDKEAVKGGSSQLEDRQLNNIVERERLKLTYFATKRLCDIIDKGLRGLNIQERKVLDRFYINRTKDYVERLMDELGYEKSRIYQIKDDALYKFTITMYGLLEY